jgi:plasmid stabilization system protein ParE
MGEVWPVKVRYTRRAAQQLETVLAYIQQRSPQGAQHVMDRLEAAIALLTDPSPRRTANWQARHAPCLREPLSLRDFLSGDRR